MPMESDSKKNETIVEAVQRLAEPILADLGLELVEVQYRREQTGFVLRLIIYKESGVSLDDCSSVSRQLGHLLEVEDLIEHAYHLEVSSPGLTRPLKNEKDFNRCLGKEVKVTVKDPVKGVLTFTGTIERAGNGEVILNSEGNDVRIAVKDIAKAKQVIRF